jgi:hypothetical protein
VDSGLRIGDRWNDGCGMKIEGIVGCGLPFPESSFLNPESSDRQSAIAQSTTSDQQSSTLNHQ